MAAFRKAIAAGVDMIELDVRMTKDYHLVVMHDRTVRRTTNGTGAVCEMSLQDLKSLDAGSWYGPRFRGEQVPTLREVMEMLPSRVGLNIEVKTDGDRRPDRALEESLVLIIREQNMTSRVLVSSFNHGHLRRMHMLDPSIPLGVLYVPVRDLARAPSALARRCGASAFICSRTQVRKRFVADAHKHGLVVAVYGVNTAEQYWSMKSYGIDAIVTDDPDKIARLMQEK
jgi:glycerophosphoryl diester phosphodiesterase